MSLSSSARARGGLVLIGGGLTLAFARCLPADGLGYPTCLFRALTGAPCPTCGLTRAFIALAHFAPQRALALHPLSGLLFTLLCAGVAISVAQLASGHDLLGGSWRTLRKPMPATLVALLALQWMHALWQHVR